MTVKNDDPTMRGSRSRNGTSGRMRQKRSDTHAGTIEHEYNVDLGCRSDKHLGTLFAELNVDSLSQLLKAAKRS